MMEKFRKHFKEFEVRAWGKLKNNCFSIIVGLTIPILALKLWKQGGITYEDIAETVKISVTVLISMLGFSVSIYIFLNNTLQNRRNSNELEKEVIDLFQAQRRKALLISITFSAFAITAECAVAACATPLKTLFLAASSQIDEVFYFIVVIIFAVITLINVYKLVNFTYGVINYEEGLKKLASREIETYKKNSYNKEMSKGEFLNLVNNIEVLVERLVRNHLHAKSSTAYDSNLKRAICDGITEPGDINTREKLAGYYKEIIDYRNLLLQNTSLADSEPVTMGDQIKSLMNQFFQHYLKGELLTGVNISNFEISEADLEKASFSNSSLQKITFKKNAKLINTDFRDSTINNVVFESADCDSINFSGCKLINVRFNTNMNLQRAIFTNADLSGMGDIGPQDKEGDQLKFLHANFIRANLTHQDIYNVSFKFADFSNARLIDSKIGTSAQKKNNTNFAYAEMEKADLLRCRIERTDFQNANLSCASFTSAVISNANFAECRLNNANFSESSIMDCSFEKSYCTNFSMKGAILNDCVFTYAIMASADMSGAQIQNVKFTDAVCRDTLWVRVQIQDSMFQRCVLANARIVGDAKQRGRISNCKFFYTDLSNSAITNIEFNNCDFLGADFTNARLINVRFINCKNLDSAVPENIWLANVSFIGEQGTAFRLKNYKCRYAEGVFPALGTIEGDDYANNRDNIQKKEY